VCRQYLVQPSQPGILWSKYEVTGQAVRFCCHLVLYNTVRICYLSSSLNPVTNRYWLYTGSVEICKPIHNIESFMPYFNHEQTMNT
jgi:hypothetical protein